MESGLNSDTVQVEVLPEDIVVAPVFVDSTGKRKRRFRTLGFVAGGLGVAYAAMLGLSFAGGPIAPNALLPVPGMPTAAPLANPEPESSMSAVSDEQIARGDSNERGFRIGSTATPKPGSTSGTPKPGAPTPKPSATTAKPPVVPAPTKTTVVPTPSKTTPAPTTPAPTTPAATTPAPTTPAATTPAATTAAPTTGTGGGTGGGGSQTSAPADPPATTSAPTTAAPITATPESSTES
ncbi:hypothetical protein [Cryptosporangium aurantiacum]|uniref:Uncharacterized protein n=1 Tax=Cryptosporangium aurantiacum TaxID=134849 RepID=A0A1M7Q774_9ACTN|nr:hypothetical protein [Cryptosporangium aurantiacum]SHN26353.1 hypothetical protein SAMN05443668_104250 [Cryptosporangium aurantiacum]